MIIFKSIKGKTIAALSVFTLVFIAIFISTFYVTSSKNSDSLLINISGRERMLIQKISKETLVYVALPQSEKVKKETIQKSMLLFEKSLYALADGGETFSDLEMKTSVFLPAPQTEEIKAQFSRLKENWEGCKKLLYDLIGSRAVNQGNIEKLVEQCTDYSRSLDDAVSMIQKNSESKLSLLLTIQIIGFILFVLVGWFFYSIITRSLVKPVSVMVDTFEKISEGDLTVGVDHSTNDEIGKLTQCINKVVNNLAEIIRLVKASSYEVNKSADEIVTGGDDLASRTNEEAASITETSATLEELTSIVKQNRTNSEEIGSSIIAFNREIHSKNELMTDVTETMKEIHESGRKIDAIVNVINDISFQTNLLALNAAVEAARAGEAGRGFAVVASEVRNLAQKTAESSKTIQDIVSRNVESTEKGMDLVRQTADFFSTILRVMQDIENRIEQITDGSKQQATGVEQINTSVNQLENVINQNAAYVEVLSATAKNLKSNSMELRKLMDHFQIGDAQSTSQVKSKVASASISAPKSTVASTASKSSPSLSGDKNVGGSKVEKSDKKVPVETKSSKPIAPQPVKEIKATTPPSSSGSQKKSAPSKEEDFFGMDDDGFEEF